jgi:methylenetetrahydrofolate reductase (NADPH)
MATLLVDSAHDGCTAMEPRFEVLPFGKGIEQSLGIGEKLHLTVTTSPKHGVDHSVEVAEQIRGAGHTVTLHVAARMVRGEDHLTEILERARGCGIDDLFVIGGDAEEPLGPFTAAGELLEILVEHPLRPATIGIGAYPEGHPLIAPDVLEAVLQEKAKVADYIVTQLCFDVGVLRNWLEGVRARGIEQPVLLGAVGPVERLRLLEIATRIGVGPSLRFLRKQRGITQLFRRPAHSATKFYDEAAPYAAKRDLGIGGFHFFTFNDLTGTRAWELERNAKLRESGKLDGR